MLQDIAVCFKADLLNLKIIESSQGLIGQVPQDIKEGTLLPETYFYSYNDTKLSIVKRMQDAMKKHIDELWEKRDPSIPVQTKQSDQFDS